MSWRSIFNTHTPPNHTHPMNTSSIGLHLIPLNIKDRGAQVFYMHTLTHTKIKITGSVYGIRHSPDQAEIERGAVFVPMSRRPAITYQEKLNFFYL